MYLRVLAFFLLAHLSTMGLAQGFDEDFEILQGDYNEDGNLDFYIRQKPEVIIIHGDIITPIILPPDVKEFVLLQDASANASFSIKDNFESEKLKAFSKSSVALQYGDFNFDGVVDLILSGIENVISGGLDQIIFANGLPDTPPFSSIPMDDNLVNFIRDFNNWAVNSSYFDDNAPILTEEKTVTDTIFLAEWCATPEWVEENGPLDELPPVESPLFETLEEVYDYERNFLAECFSSGRTVLHYDFLNVKYKIKVGEKDYSVFNQEALETARVLESTKTDEGVIKVDPGSREAEKISEILGRVFHDPTIFDRDKDGKHDTTKASDIFYDNSFEHVKFPEDDLFDPNDVTFHHYDVLNKICDIGTKACEIDLIRDEVLKLFSYPSKRMAPTPASLDGRPVVVYIAGPIIEDAGDPRSYDTPGGRVVQAAINDGIRNTTLKDHFAYPGTISRMVIQKEGALYFFTHGIGLNKVFGLEQETLRGLHMLFALVNDVYGPKAFDTLDKQAIEYWKEKYVNN